MPNSNYYQNPSLCTLKESLQKIPPLLQILAKQSPQTQISLKCMAQIPLTQEYKAMLKILDQEDTVEDSDQDYWKKTQAQTLILKAKKQLELQQQMQRQRKMALLENQLQRKILDQPKKHMKNMVIPSSPAQDSKETIRVMLEQIIKKKQDIKKLAIKQEHIKQQIEAKQKKTLLIQQNQIELQQSEIRLSQLLKQHQKKKQQLLDLQKQVDIQFQSQIGSQIQKRTLEFAKKKYEWNQKMKLLKQALKQAPKRPRSNTQVQKQ